MATWTSNLWVLIPHSAHLAMTNLNKIDNFDYTLIIYIIKHYWIVYIFHIFIKLIGIIAPLVLLVITKLMAINWKFSTILMLLLEKYIYL